MDFSAILIVLIIVLGSMILHELAHGVVAYILGDRTAKEAGRLTLNPLKHLDPVMSVAVPVLLFLMKAPVFGGAKPVPVDSRNLKGKEWGMAGVAIAGPLTNLLLALIFFLIGHFTGLLYTGSYYVMFFFTEMVLINIGFGIFNLIPIPPLDGSRIIYAIAPDGVRNFLNNIERYGVIIIYSLILIFGSAFSYLMSNGISGVLNFFYWIVSA